jgi:hypothetical protein
MVLVRRFVRSIAQRDSLRVFATGLPVLSDPRLSFSTTADSAELTALRRRVKELETARNKLLAQTWDIEAHQPSALPASRHQLGKDTAQDQVLTLDAGIKAHPPPSKTNGSTQAVDFDLVRCSDENGPEIEMHAKAGAIFTEYQSKAQRTVSWHTRPKKVLIIKKPHAADVMDAFEHILTWLKHKKGMDVVVEPNVLKEMEGNKCHADLETYSDRQVSATISVRTC